MAWTFKPASFFEAIRPFWDEINRARGHHILLDSGFVAPLFKHFASSRVLIGLNQNSQHSGVVLLTPRGFGRWETFQPSQAPIGLFLLRESDENGESLKRLLTSLPGIAVELSVLQQDPDFSALTVNHTAPTFERNPYIETAKVLIAGTFEDYWKSRGSNLRHNLARRRRRLAERGIATELVARRSSAEVSKAIGEYGRLESTGWKGQNGTAVRLENAQGRFYRDLFEHFCERGEAVIYQFLADGKVIASDLCLTRGEMMIVLKTAYDEEMNEYSPALLMREEIMKEIFSSNQIRVVEFYGRVMDWHKRWTEQTRTMFHMTCLRYRWLPALKGMLKRKT